MKWCTVLVVNYERAGRHLSRTSVRQMPDKANNDAVLFSAISTTLERADDAKLTWFTSRRKKHKRHLWMLRHMLELPGNTG